MSVCRIAVCWLLFSIISGLPSARFASAEEKNDFEKFRQAAMKSGDPTKGQKVFASKKANCVTCHRIGGDQQKPGPDLIVVGDKFSRRQLVRAVLQPSSQIHPDYATRLVTTADGKTHTGIVRQRNNTEIQLFDAQGKLLRLPVKDVDEEKRGKVSLMPTGLTKSLDTDQFADLIAYLTTLKQNVIDHPGIPTEIPQIAKPIKLVPFHTKEMKFADPVCIIAMPGTKNEFLIVEQKTRKIWRLIEGPNKDRKELFVDMSADASTGKFEGVVCLAFHPKFRENGKYYLNHHIREQGKFSPVIVERQANTDRTRDSGKPSRRLLRIPHKTSLHWAACWRLAPMVTFTLDPAMEGPRRIRRATARISSGGLVRSCGSMSTIGTTASLTGFRGIIPTVNREDGSAPRSGPRGCACHGDSVLIRPLAISGSATLARVCLKRCRSFAAARILAGTSTRVSPSSLTAIADSEKPTQNR